MMLRTQRVHDQASAAGTLDKDNNAVNVHARTAESQAQIETKVDGGSQAAREGAQLIGGLHLGKALGQGFQVRCVCYILIEHPAVRKINNSFDELTCLALALAQGVIFELVDANGRRAPIGEAAAKLDTTALVICFGGCGACLRAVLKAAKSAALISDMEREWNAGVRVGALALPNGELPGLMKVNPLPHHQANG